MHSTQNRGGKQIIRLGNNRFENNRNNLNCQASTLTVFTKKYIIATRNILTTFIRNSYKNNGKILINKFYPRMQAEIKICESDNSINASLLSVRTKERSP